MKQRRDAARMNRLVTFRTSIGTANSLGEIVETFIDYKTAWAAIWPVSASEQIRNGKQGMDITHRIRVWYDAGIVHSMRIDYGTRTFKIESIINQDESNRMLDILATEEL